MSLPHASAAPQPDEDDESGLTPREIFDILRQRIKALFFVPLAVGAIALGAMMLVPATFTASTTFMPPQQAQSGTAAALAALGPLAGLAGAAGSRTPADQYISLMQSVSVSDRIVDRFKLMQVYDVAYQVDARRELESRVRMSLGKKDGLITVEVDDHSPQRAAEIANRYVDELRRMTSEIAVTEAQQRRIFFEQQLKHSRERLVKAQLALQASGFNPGAIKAEPKAAAEDYARIRAALTSTEIGLTVARSSLADNSPELRQREAAVAALRGQLARIEQPSESATGGPDYVSRYRDFKYEETLFDLYARQFELARIDESREGALIQVVDPATPPEKKSKPKRGLTAVIAALLTGFGMASWFLFSYSAQSTGSRHRRTPA